MDHEHLRERARARIGTVVRQKWTIEKLLGLGGMGAVYAATHRNRKRAALKFLHCELSSDSNVRTRFLREGYVANSLGHAAVVRIDDDDVAEDGSAFLVMELLDGESVQERWRRNERRLPPAEVLTIADRVLDLLALAHARGIVHRDLKPENLFVTRDNVLKVLDFGIARICELEPAGDGTLAGSLLGTPAFMAPEQARGRWNEVDGRTDLWALGATMMTLLAGRPPHLAETASEIRSLAAVQQACSIASLMPGLPSAVAEIVDRALAYRPNERFMDAEAMRAAVRAACTDCPCDFAGLAIRTPCPVGHSTQPRVTARIPEWEMPTPQSRELAVRLPILVDSAAPTALSPEPATRGRSGRLWAVFGTLFATALFVAGGTAVIHSRDSDAHLRAPAVEPPSNRSVHRASELPTVEQAVPQTAATDVPEPSAHHAVRHADSVAASLASVRVRAASSTNKVPVAQSTIERLPTKDAAGGSLTRDPFARRR